MTMAIPNPAANDRLSLLGRNKRLGIKLGFLAIFMIGFTVVLWWSAGILCDWAGIGLNPNSAPRSEIRMSVPAVQLLEAE